MLLPLDEGQLTQVFLAKPEQVERIERNLYLPAHQWHEMAFAFSVEADDFTVQDRRCVQLCQGLTQRYERTATLLLDGRVLITGGMGPSGDLLVTAEMFDPARGVPLPASNSSVVWVPVPPAMR